MVLPCLFVLARMVKCDPIAKWSAGMSYGLYFSSLDAKLLAHCNFCVDGLLLVAALDHVHYLADRKSVV